MKQQLEGEIERLGSMPGKTVPSVIVSPYRICPIGAHSDHQGGPVLGMAVSIYTLLAYAATDGSQVRLRSENYPGKARFDLRKLSAEDDDDDAPSWAAYARGAARALAPRLSARPRGMEGLVTGGLPGGGLSSSASFILACLLALADVNGLALEDRELATLALEAERDHVGVKVGILDPATIVAARKDHLVAIDTRRVRWEALPLGGGSSARILVAFSGVTRNLTGTDYNRRVEECFAAARKLGRLTGQEALSGLDELEADALEEHRHQLTAAEARRARHFFTERSRVRRGVELWREGDLPGFGELMRASCQSSIQDWESGSSELVTIQRILEEKEGVFGSRFSGAGWGGCCIALVDADRADGLCASVERDIRDALPELDARVSLVESEDGLRRVSVR